MLGFDFGTIGFHAKSAMHFVWMSTHILSPKNSKAGSEALQVLSEHSDAVAMFWWS